MYEQCIWNAKKEICNGIACKMEVMPNFSAWATLGKHYSDPMERKIKILFNKHYCSQSKFYYIRLIKDV